MRIPEKHTKTMVAVFGLLAIILIFLPGKADAAEHSHTVSASASAPSFRMLNEYGEWIDNARFGRVWRPYVVASWRPFLYGEWDWVDSSWFWDSYEPFGWVVYHYGNWYYLQDVGWVWIPGYEWSPAQVTWVDFDDYIGWCPLAPAGNFWPEPWNAAGVVVWNIVLVRDFHQHELDKHIIRAAIPKPSVIKTFVRSAPTLGTIETATKRKIENLTTKNTNMQEGSHTIKQAELPKNHLNGTQAFRERIRREVLAPKTAVIKKH